MEIFLEQNRSKESTNVHSASHVNLKNSHKLFQQGSYDEWVSQNDIYNEERLACNHIRLTCQVNIIASNVLHNNVTEIVKNEGSTTTDTNNPLICLNYKDSVPDIVSDSIICKGSTKDIWMPNDTGTTVEAIRDTQLSNSKCGYVYHPGKDFFNNHIIRSKTFKPICYQSESTNVFNTISDVIRQENISDKNEYPTITEYVPYPLNANLTDNTKVVENLHIYKYDDILTYKDSLDTKLTHRYDGWYGFINSVKLNTLSDFNSTAKTDTSLLINKVINTANAGDFIDMYPGRDLYSFCPKYNKYKHRLEKNWNYILTYPSSSITNGISFIDTATNVDTNLPNNSLRIYAIDENTTTDSGTKQLVIYSISKHGLKEGDYVNVYYDLTDDSGKTYAYTLLNNVEVLTVVDDFIFTVFADGYQISDEWVDTTDESLITGDILTVNDKSYNINSAYLLKNGIRYPIINGYANIDENKQKLSYKKLDSGLACDYYVRIFSKLPNFKYAKEKVNSYNLYKNGGTLISECQTIENEFENHISRLAFAKNIYGDDIGQIVFSDDIQFTELKDNRGRPLTTLYLTFLKNNAGYKEWYGKNGEEINLDSEDIEYSHCFGKLTCGFIESIESTNINARMCNIRVMNNVLDSDLPSYGLNMSKINTSRDENDEIDYKKDVNFYGDLVCYNHMQAQEEQIQYVMNRFNTAQRELTNKDESYVNFEDNLIDDIQYDDYDINSFTVESQKITEYFGANTSLCQRPEGYFYCPHYPIQIRTFSSLESMYPDFLNIKTFKYNNDNTYSICTFEYHYLGVGDKIVFYNSKQDILLYGNVTKVYDYKSFRCTFTLEDNTTAPISAMPISLFSQDADSIEYKLYKIGSMDIPEYAELLRDGSCRYLWRDVLQNGEDNSSDIEIYPFTNGALYVNKLINLHIRRQDPYGENGLWTSAYPQDSIKTTLPDENNYIEEEDIKC